MNSDIRKQDSHSGKRRSGSIKLLAVLIVVGGLVLVLLLAIALPSKNRDVPANDPPVVNVVVQTIKLQPQLADSFLLPGVVEPNRVVNVAAEVSGQIEQFGLRKTPLEWKGQMLSVGEPIEKGQPVTAGDCLLILNTDLLQATYDSDKAQAEYDAREYDRMLQLYEKNVAARGELDQSKTRMEMSKAALAKAAENLKRANILAPISGILDDRPEEIGQYVQPGMYVAEIVDIRIAKVVVDVPEMDVAYLAVGEEASVLLDLDGQRTIQGTITFISEQADEKTRTTRVEVSVPNQPRQLRSGQIVRVRMTRRVLKDVIMIPLAAVTPLEQGRVVYVAEGDTAQRRDVALDLSLIKGTEVCVTSGLVDGDRLIVIGHRYVGPGQKIRIQPSEAASQPSQDQP